MMGRPLLGPLVMALVHRRQLLLFQVVPTVLLLVVAALPLIDGSGTLFYRDVSTTHLPLTEAFAHGLEAGRLPLVDPHRASGQALVGNPNAVALYPTRLLHAFMDPLRVHNAHFWIHWLLAPFAGWWLGRAFGLRHAAAWTVGVAWASSGFFLSQMNLMNLVAGATLAPALVAAARDLRVRVEGRTVLALGLLWGLLLVAGDPSFAALALFAATVAFGRPRSSRSLAGAGLALGAGTLLAAPQLVELLRILPTSFRGFWEMSPRAVLAQSWDPRSVLELFLPLAFGGPDLGFWGFGVHGGNPPLFHSLSPGPVALALAVCGSLPGPRSAARRWALVLCGVGVFVALGAFNPAVRAALALPGASVLRYPVKAWLLVALALSLLAGSGAERLLRGGRRVPTIVFGGLAVLYAGTFVAVARFGSLLVERAGALSGGRVLPEVLAVQPARWTAIALTGLLFVLAALAVVRLVRAERAVAILGVLLLGGTGVLLGPLVDIDATAAYRSDDPELALPAGVGPDNRIAHGSLRGLFPGTGDASGFLRSLPDRRLHWLARLHARQLVPASGVAHGLRYAYNPSTEGLDTFTVFALSRAVPRLPDDEHRVRLLQRTGVDRLVLDRALDGSVDLGAPIATLPGALVPTRVWALDAPPAVRLAHVVREAPSLDAALEVLVGPDFDPATDVVVAGGASTHRGSEEGTPVSSARRPGTAVILASEAEVLDVETRSPDGGVLVTDRAWLPLWTARIDGIETPVRVVDGFLLGVDVPAGVRRVRFEVDRRPFRVGIVLSVAGLLLLVGIADRFRFGVALPGRNRGP